MLRVKALEDNLIQGLILIMKDGFFSNEALLRHTVPVQALNFLCSLRFKFHWARNVFSPRGLIFSPRALNFSNGIDFLDKYKFLMHVHIVFGTYELFEFTIILN
jgi:hypothetical protein